MSDQEYLMKKLPVSAIVGAVFIAVLVFSLVACDPISLKQTIDNLVLGWTRAVTLTSPENESEIAEKTPLLDWEDAGGATGYQVQISESESFDGITPIDIEEAVSEYEIPEPLIIGNTRYWRVRAVNGETASEEWSEAYSFSIIPSSAPELVNTLTIGEKAWGITTDGEYLYSSAGVNGLKMFDISDPASPVLTDTFPTANGIWGIDVVGDYAYASESIGSADYYVYLLDVSEPTNIVEIDSHTYSNQMYGLKYAGICLFVGLFDGYYRFDSIPPNLDGTPDFEDPGAGERVNSFAQTGGYLVYTVDNMGIEILRLNGNTVVGSASAKALDVTDPPAFSNSMVTIYGNYAYVTTMDCSFIEIFNLENISSPESVATYDLPTAGNNISVIDHFAFVSVFDGSIRILDLSSPTAPELIGTIPSETAEITVHTVAGNYLYGTNFATGELFVVDLVPEGE